MTDYTLVKLEDMEPPDGMGRLLATLFNEAAAEYELEINKHIANFVSQSSPNVILHPSENRRVQALKKLYAMPGDKQGLVELFQTGRDLTLQKRILSKTVMYFTARDAMNNVLEKRNFKFRIF